MNPLTILWRLLSTDEIAKFSDALAKVQRDQTEVVNDFVALTAAASKFAQSAKKENADLAPIIQMLKELHG